MTETSSPVRRRVALKYVGGLLSATVAGCATPGLAFESYQYESDAPIGGSPARPWPTLAHDARRSGSTRDGWVPHSSAADVFVTARRSSGIQPAFVDGVTYFGGRRLVNRGHEKWFGPSGVRALDGDGEGWFVRENDPLASPTVVGNALLVSSRGTTRAYDRRDGKLCWAFRGGSSHPTASPTVVGGTVYVVGERLYALAARTGEVRWASDPLPFRARGTAATRDGVFATTATQDRAAVFRIEPDTGRTTWTIELDTGVHVAPVLGELLYVVDADGRLRALDPADGSESWSRNLGGRTSAMPAVAGETVYAVATHGNALKAFDAVTGTERWRFEFSSARARGPTVAGNTVYLPTSDGDDGFVYGFGAESGAIRRFYEIPQRPTVPVVVTVGRMLVSADSPNSPTRIYSIVQGETDE